MGINVGTQYDRGLFLPEHSHCICNSPTLFLKKGSCLTLALLVFQLTGPYLFLQNKEFCSLCESAQPTSCLLCARIAYYFLEGRKLIQLRPIFNINVIKNG